MTDPILAFVAARDAARAHRERARHAARAAYMRRGREIAAAVEAERARGGDRYAQAAAIQATAAYQEYWRAVDEGEARTRAALAALPRLA